MAANQPQGPAAQLQGAILPHRPIPNLGPAGSLARVTEGVQDGLRTYMVQIVGPWHRARIRALVGLQGHHTDIVLGPEEYRLISGRLRIERQEQAYARSWMGQLRRLWADYDVLIWISLLPPLLVLMFYLLTTLMADHGLRDALRPWVVGCALELPGSTKTPTCYATREDLIKLRHSAKNVLVLEDLTTFVGSLVCEAREVAADVMQLGDIADPYDTYKFDRTLTQNATRWAEYSNLKDECEQVQSEPRVRRDDFREDFRLVHDALRRLHARLREVVLVDITPALQDALGAAHGACEYSLPSSAWDFPGYLQMHWNAFTCWCRVKLGLRGRRDRILRFVSLVDGAATNATKQAETDLEVLTQSNQLARLMLDGTGMSSAAPTSEQHFRCFFFFDDVSNTGPGGGPWWKPKVSGAGRITRQLPIMYPGNDPARARRAVEGAVRLYARQIETYNHWLADNDLRGWDARRDAWFAHGDDFDSWTPRWQSDQRERERRQSELDDKRQKSREISRGDLAQQLGIATSEEYMGAPWWPWFPNRKPIR